MVRVVRVSMWIPRKTMAVVGGQTLSGDDLRPREGKSSPRALKVVMDLSKVSAPLKKSV